MCRYSCFGISVFLVYRKFFLVNTAVLLHFLNQEQFSLSAFQEGHYFHVLCICVPFLWKVVLGNDTKNLINCKNIVSSELD